MLSRVAERLYWMSRYIERAENTARLLNVYSLLMLDLPRGVGVHWRQLIEITGAHDIFNSSYRSDGEPSVLRFMAGDRNNPSSLITTLTLARENVRTTRDQIPSDAWKTINELYLFAKRRLASPNFRKNIHHILSEVIALCQQTTGLLAGTMSHGPGYQFVRIGRNIERADMTTRIIDVGSATLIAEGNERERLANRLWMNILHALSAHQMYRQNVRRRIRRDNVIQYLIQDTRFPRSVAHTLLQLEKCTEQLPNYEATLQSILRLKAIVNEADVVGLADETLHQFIDDLQVEFAEVHKVMNSTWFSPN